MAGLMAKGLPGNHHPPAQPTVMQPRLIELCFQTAGIWEMSVQGSMGLPQHVHKVRFYGTPVATEGSLFAVVTPDPDRGAFTPTS